MTSIRSGLVVLMFELCTIAQAHAICDETNSLLDRACQHITDTWQQGGNDRYIPFHSYHLRSAYTEEKVDSFQEDAWGLGYGRSRYDESGNWDGLYAMAFPDSHGKLEPILGYGHQWIWGERAGLHAGLGYTAFLTARADVDHYLPIPGILPIASVSYREASVNTAFVPGGSGYGNIFFFWTKFGF